VGGAVQNGMEGTSSQRFSRQARYSVLNQIDAVYDREMADLANTPLTDPNQLPPDDLLPVDDDDYEGRSHR
jgi:hypothetical protein